MIVLPCATSPFGALCCTTMLPVHVYVGDATTSSPRFASASLAALIGCCVTSGSCTLPLETVRFTTEPFVNCVALPGSVLTTVPSGTSFE